MSDVSENHVELKPELYTYTVLGIAFVFVIAIFLTIFTENFGIHIGSNTVSYASIFLVFLFTYCVASIRFVKTNEIGGVSVLQIPSKEIGAGPYFVPIGLMTVTVIPLSEQEAQFPGDPEMVYKGPDEKAPAGMLRPIRAITGAKDPDEAQKDNPLNAQVSVEYSFSIRYIVQKSNKIFDFLINTSGDSWAERRESIEKSIRDTGETIVSAKIAVTKLLDLSAELPRINNELHQELQAAVTRLGIHLIEVKIQQIDYGHNTNKALESIVVATAQAKATERTAQAKKATLIAEGEGVADARRNALAAEGKGVYEAAIAMDMSPSDYRAGEIAKATIGESTIILGETGIAQAMVLGKTILEKKEAGENV
jgi:regulator of protease activity HflC (stomatin/prohibitin superfamily)